MRSAAATTTDDEPAKTVPHTASRPAADHLARRCGLAVLTAAAVAAAVLGLLSVQRYRDFQEARFDLGNVVQVVFNTAHGHVLEASDPSGQEVSRLASHVDPVLAVFAVPWLVWPNPAMLLVAQAVIVALAAWPAYRLGLRILGDPRAAMCCAFGLLLYPPLEYAVLNDFHAVTLAIPLLLWGFLFLEEDHRWRAVALLALAALCKEEVPLVIAFMGCYFALRKRALWPLAVTAGALAYFALAVFVVIPHFNHAASPFIGRYSQYGDTAGAVARHILLHPVSAITDYFAPRNVIYQVKLLAPFAFASLLSPLTALIALPELALNGLSATAAQRSIEYHYVAAEVPVLFAAAVLGLARIGRYLTTRRRPREALESGDDGARRWSLRLALVVLAACLIANYVAGPLPFALPGARFGFERYAVGNHARTIGAAIAGIPANAAVSAQNRIGGHLSARRTVYLYPYIGAARYVVLDKHGIGYLGLNEPPPEKRLFAVAQALLSSPRFRLIFNRGGVLVYERVD